MLKKLICFIITFTLIIILLNFLKKQTYENYTNISFSIPENVIKKYSGRYFTNNSHYNSKLKRYMNLLHLNLKKNLISIGKSIKNKELENKQITITNFIDPSTIIANYNDMTIIIKLLDNNNITLNYKKNDSNTWISLNPNDISYLKKIAKDENNKIKISQEVTKKVSIPEMTKMNNIKSIFKKFKFNKTNSLRSINVNANHQLIHDSKNVILKYSYVYNYTHELLNSFNFQTKNNNIDSEHHNMKNENYGLVVQIPFHKDFETNNLKNITKHINHINIGIYYKGKKTIEDLIFINNKSPIITLNYNNLLNKYIAKVNNGKTFCYFGSKKKGEKCGDITFPYMYSKSENEKNCLNKILPSVYSKCNNSVKIRPCIYNFKNETLHRKCYDPNRLFYNVDYYTNQFSWTSKTINDTNIKNILKLNNHNNHNIHFKFISADKKYGSIKYGEPVYIYCKDKSKYNDDPNGHGIGTPFSFNQHRPKYKLYLYPYNINHKSDSVFIDSKFILSSKAFTCENNGCSDTWTSNCGYYSCRVTNNSNNTINFNHGSGTEDTSIGSSVQYIKLRLVK